MAAAVMIDEYVETKSRPTLALVATTRRASLDDERVGEICRTVRAFIFGQPETRFPSGRHFNPYGRVARFSDQAMVRRELERGIARLRKLQLSGRVHLYPGIESRIATIWSTLV